MVPPGPQRHPILLELVAQAEAFTASRGLDLWLTAGSLLGAVREGGIIPWDDDADMAMLMADAQMLWKARAEFERESGGQHAIVRTSLLWPMDKYFDLNTLAGVLPRTTFLRVVDLATGIFVDIFVYARVSASRMRILPWDINCFTCGNRPSCQQAALMDQAIDVVLPLTPCNLNAVQVRCPNQPREYVAREFGADWQTPRRTNPTKVKLPTDSADNYRAS